MHCIFIVGAGRSGTSLLASLFQELDTPPVSSFKPREANPGGFYEDARVNAINERILSRFLSSECPLQPRSYHSSSPGPGQMWLARLHKETALDLNAEERDEIRNILGNKGFCIKDPRLCYTLALWHLCLLSKQRAALKHICIFRHPARVISSVHKELLAARYLHNLSISVDHIIECWQLQYEWILARHRHLGKWFFVDYESLFFDSTILALESFCGVKLVHSQINPDLNRSNRFGVIPESVRILYESLRLMENASIESHCNTP